MRKMKETLLASARELKKTGTLATAAMLLAIAVVLGFFSIQVTDSIKISFSFLVDQVTGLLFGPVVAAIVGGSADILKYIVRPTGPFFPGFTISEILGGLIYGFLYYRRTLTIRRILTANVIVTIFVNILLNTFWISVLYGLPFFGILPARIIKQFIFVPLNVVLFRLLIQLLKKAKLFQKLSKA